MKKTVVAILYLFFIFPHLNLTFSSTQKSSPNLVIFSFDGGGYRGIYSLQILKRLQDALNDKGMKGSVFSLADHLAGTSTGAIIATAGANNASIEEIMDMYDTKARDIFTYTLGSYLPGHNLIYDKYTNGREKVFKELFSEETLLKDLPKKIMIPAFPLSLPLTPVTYFTSYASNQDTPVWKALMATTAAETYFPSFSINDILYTDGGNSVNNPELDVFLQALTNSPKAKQILLLSIGTGISPAKPIGKSSANGGLLTWFENGIIDVLMNAASELPDHQTIQLAQLLNKLGKDIKIFRINTIIDGIALDDYSKTAKEKLILKANETIDSHAEQFEELTDLLFEIYQSK